jgi:hypothetical protein
LTAVRQHHADPEVAASEAPATRKHTVPEKEGQSLYMCDISSGVNATPAWARS